jgi:GT2 family glycosyltransferase
MNFSISISLHNRPKYTKTLLDYLNKCSNIDKYEILIFCEPSSLEVIQLAQDFRPEQTIVTVNPSRFGCNRNIYQSIKRGFELSDFHIHLEDDTIPGKDFLVYMEFCGLSYKDKKDIFSISGYVNNDNNIEQFYSCNKNNSSYITTRNWFTPWGWATWIDRWDEIEKAFINSLDSHDSWDIMVHKLLQQRKEVFPTISRIQNIGALNGTYCPGPEWHKKNQFNEYWIETNQQYCSMFYEI